MSLSHAGFFLLLAVSVCSRFNVFKKRGAVCYSRSCRARPLPVTLDNPCGCTNRDAGSTNSKTQTKESSIRSRNGRHTQKALFSHVGCVRSVTAMSEIEQFTVRSRLFAALFISSGKCAMSCSSGMSIADMRAAAPEEFTAALSPVVVRETQVVVSS